MVEADDPEEEEPWAKVEGVGDQAPLETGSPGDSFADLINSHQEGDRNTNVSSDVDSSTEKEENQDSSLKSGLSPEVIKPPSP